MLLVQVSSFGQRMWHKWLLDEMESINRGGKYIGIGNLQCQSINGSPLVLSSLSGAIFSS